MTDAFNFLDYELRGHQIGVTMAEKSAPKAPAFGHGYNLVHSFPCVQKLS